MAHDAPTVRMYEDDAQEVAMTGDRRGTGSRDGASDRDGHSRISDERWREVVRLLEANARARTQLEARETALLREARTCDVPARLGYVSLEEFVERHLGYGRHAANERCRVSLQLDALPQLRGAYEAGTLAFSHVRELTRVATPQTEGAYLAAAAGKTTRQVQQLVSGKRAGDAPEAPPDPALVKHTVMLELGGEAFAMWRRAQQVLEEEVGERLSADELVMQLCSQAFAPAPAPAFGEGAPEPEVGPDRSRGTGTALPIDTDEPGSARSRGTGTAMPGTDDPPASVWSRGTGTALPSAAASSVRHHARTRPPRVAPPPTLHAVTTCRTCQHATASGAGSAEPLTPAQRDRALCDAIHVGDLETSVRTRPTLTVPSAIRRKVAIACHHACVVPGCRSRRYLTIHHLRYQAHGGGHTVESCIQLCHAHHQRLHEGRLRIEGTAPHALDITWRHPSTNEEQDAGAGPWVWRRVPPDPVHEGRRP